MGSNTFGKVFTVTTAGYSHGEGGLTAIVDGVPPMMELSSELVPTEEGTSRMWPDIQKDLDRRRPGQSDIVTARNESDLAVVHTGTTMIEGDKESLTGIQFTFIYQIRVPYLNIMMILQTFLDQAMQIILIMRSMV